MNDSLYAPGNKTSPLHRGAMARILCENRALKATLRSMRANSRVERDASGDLHELQRMREANQHLILATFSAEDSKAIAVALSERQKIFLSMLSHELRNPMAAIAQANGILERQCADNPKAVRLTAIIHRQVTQLIRLSDDLLDVARISAGKISLIKEVVSLAEILDSAHETVLPLLQKRGQLFVMDTAGAPLLLWGDRTRLSQLFANLLANASKFSPVGSTVSGVIDVQTSVVEIVIKDAGRGISSASQQTIFDLFSQGANGEEHILSGGLGIGLTLVRTIAELHDGTVTVYSAGEGRGSEFIVRLPRLRS